ncbi:MAG: hypothetical protein A2992_07895 [Elusimicrobia bacterium RIFCSPLOWO2_01_FULL_59_12]|nr:MAG: hypothetical protein A2992_07895 [Elusimicrobia bacterium RIFCSPLOWO2_01_FULL_59_12]
MNILVTGGAGYVGTLLTEELLKNGHTVYVLDNFMYGYESLLHFVDHQNLHVIQKDIRNLEKKDLAGYDIIFHLAAISGAPACDENPFSAQAINTGATKRIVDHIKDSSQLLIYASTTSFYGKDNKDCDEDSPIRVLSAYGKTKYEAEQAVMTRRDSVALRFATLFGNSPRMRNDLMVNDFLYRAINEKTIVIFESFSRRTFMHIRDAVRAYLFTLNNRDRMIGEIYNVGDETLNLTKLDVAEKIKQYVDCEIILSKLSASDKRNFNVSFTKIKRLGFSTRHNIDDGIKEMMKLFSYYRRYCPYKVI